MAYAVCYLKTRYLEILRPEKGSSKTVKLFMGLKEPEKIREFRNIDTFYVPGQRSQTMFLIWLKHYVDTCGEDKRLYLFRPHSVDTGSTVVAAQQASELITDLSASNKPRLMTRSDYLAYMMSVRLVGGSVPGVKVPTTSSLVTQHPMNRFIDLFHRDCRLTHKARVISAIVNPLWFDPEKNTRDLKRLFKITDNSISNLFNVMNAEEHRTQRSYLAKSQQQLILAILSIMYREPKKIAGQITPEVKDSLCVSRLLIRKSKGEDYTHAVCAEILEWLEFLLSYWRAYLSGSLHDWSADHYTSGFGTPGLRRKFAELTDSNHI
jgi:hypothetical protein